MGIYISLKDYDNAIEFLQKTSSYNDIYNNINTVLNNLDYNVLNSVRAQLISSRDIINNTKFSVDDIKQKISKNKTIYETIESRFGKSVVAAAAVGVVATSDQIKPNLNYNSNNVPTITKIEEDTGSFLSNTWNTVSDITKEAISGVQNIVSDIGDALYNTGAKICDFFTSDDSKWAAFWKETAKKIEGAKAWASQVLKSTGASIANLAIGFSEGVAWVGEMVADTGAILGTAFECALLGAADAVAWGWDKLNGKEHEFIIGQIWDEKWTKTMEKVKESKVANAYDNFYQNNDIGKLLDANAFGLFKRTGGAYELAKNLGTVAGNLGLSFLTFGVAGGLLSGSGITAASAGQMAATAAFTGFGKGAESAWQKGATVTEGLIYGGFSGAWEGLQFYLGGKIGAPGGYGDKIAGKILSESATTTQKMLVASGSRILLDTLDGAAEGFVQPILQTIYADGYYNDNGEFVLFTKEDGPFKRISTLFDDNGGWSTVGMQALTAFSASTLGELWNLRKYRKKQKQNATATEPKQIAIIDAPEEHAYTEQLEKYPEGYKKYKNTNLPKDAVIDNMKKLKKYGSTPKEALNNIAQIYGKDSIEYMTATGTMAQMYLQSVPPESYGGIKSVTGLKSTSDRILDFYSSIGVEATDATQYVISATTTDKVKFSVAEEVCQKLFADSYNALDNIDSLTALGLEEFTAGGYYDINTALRTGNVNALDVDLQNQVKALYQYLDESPGLADTTLMYRGIGDLNWVADGQLMGLKGQELVDAINALGGGIYDIADNGFNSSTPVLGEGFTNKPIVEVTACPAGTKGAYVGNKSSISNEVEWLLNAGEANKKVILGSELIDNKVYVYTQIIGK